MKKLLRSNFLILILIFVLAAAGFALRCRQLGHELLADGALAKGSYLHIILAIQSGLAVLLLIAFLRPMKKITAWRDLAVLPKGLWILQLLAAAVLAVGNILLLSEPVVVAETTGKLAVFLAKILPYAGLVAAVSIAAFGVRSLQGRQPSALLYILTSFYLVVRLIMDFQSWNTDPSIHDYAYGLLASICCMLGTYHLAGFCLDRGKRRMTLFWLLLGVFFCGINGADTVLRGDLRDVLLNGALLLFLLVGSISLLLPKKEA